jgi:hypothetical protein
MQTSTTKQGRLARASDYLPMAAIALSALVIGVAIGLAWDLRGSDTASREATDSGAAVAVPQVDTSFTDRGMGANLGEGLMTGSTVSAAAAVPEASAGEVVIVHGPGEGLNEILVVNTSIAPPVTDERIVGPGEGLNEFLTVSTSSVPSVTEERIVGPGEGLNEVVLGSSEAASGASDDRIKGPGEGLND